MLTRPLSLEMRYIAKFQKCKYRFSNHKMKSDTLRNNNQIYLMMEKTKPATILVALTIMTSTISLAQTNKNSTNKIKYHSSARENLDWQGGYFGITAGTFSESRGIETLLVLSENNHYTLTTLSRETATNSETINGKFKWDGNTIILQGIKKGTKPTKYKVEENQVKQLDTKGNEIKGELWATYLLYKTGNVTVEN